MRSFELGRTSLTTLQHFREKLPTINMSDPKALIGARVDVVGYGVGKIESFRKLWSGGSPHTVLFDDGR